jgi:hypothetical protein
MSIHGRRRLRPQIALLSVEFLCGDRMLTENALECDAAAERFRDVIAHIFDSSPAIRKALGALGVGPLTGEHTKSLRHSSNSQTRDEVAVAAPRRLSSSRRSTPVLSVSALFFAKHRIRSSGSDEPHRTAAKWLLQASGRDRVANGVAGNNKFNSPILLAAARVIVGCHWRCVTEAFG